jgi:hypothetical protein
VNRHRRSPKGLGRLRFAFAELREVIDEKHEAIADADRRVHDPPAIGGRQAADLFGTERLLVKLDGVHAGVEHQMRDQAFHSCL